MASRSAPPAAIYAADKDHNRIAEFNGAVAASARVFGHGDSGPGELHHPCCVAAEGLGPVYVADTGNSRIEKFTRDGRFLRAWGRRGAGHDQFFKPKGIAVDTKGNVYVADAGAGLNRIQKFTSDGKFRGVWGKPGLGPWPIR